MNHHPELELTALAALGKLDDLDRRRLVAHLPRCAECRAELADLQALTALLGREPEELEIPASRRRWLVAAGVGLSAAAAVAGVLLVTTSSGSTPQVRTVSLAAAPAAPAASGRITVRTDAQGGAVAVRVAGLPVSVRCTVYVVDGQGHRDKVLTWAASYEGASTEQGHTALTAEQVRSVELVTDDGTPLMTGHA